MNQTFPLPLNTFFANVIPGLFIQLPIEEWHNTPFVLYTSVIVN